MSTRNLRRLRLLCGLTQFELAAGSNVGMHRIAQAEQGRIELTETEQTLIGVHLHRHWEWLSALDPEGTRVLACEVAALIGSSFAHPLILQAEGMA